MKRKEMYAKKIVEFAVNDEQIAIHKTTLHPESCDEIGCVNCLRRKTKTFVGFSCSSEALQLWAESEVDSDFALEDDDLKEKRIPRKVKRVVLVMENSLSVEFDGRFVIWYNIDCIHQRFCGRGNYEFVPEGISCDKFELKLNRAGNTTLSSWGLHKRKFDVIRGVCLVEFYFVYEDGTEKKETYSLCWSDEWSSYGWNEYESIRDDGSGNLILCVCSDDFEREKRLKSLSVHVDKED